MILVLLTSCRNLSLNAITVLPAIAVLPEYTVSEESASSQDVMIITDNPNDVKYI